MVVIDLDIDHYSTHVNIVVKTTINQDAKDESWGIRNFELFVERLKNDQDDKEISPKPFYTAFTS